MGRRLGVVFEIGARAMSSVASAFGSVESRVRNLRGSLSRSRTIEARASALNTAAQRLQSRQAAYAANPTAALRRELLAAQRAYAQAERAAARYGISVAEAARIQARAADAIRRTEAALARQERRMANQARRREMHGQIMGTVAAVATVAAPVKLAMDYETAMADVKKVTNFDAPGWQVFSKDLLTLSTQIPLTADGLAQIAAAAGQAGIAEEELLRFTKDAAVMAVAFDIQASEAGSAMTGLRTNFKLNQDGVISLGDSYNHLANNMDATAGEIINFATRAGRVGSIYNFTGEQMGAMGAAFIAMKMPAEVAARASNSLFMKLGMADEAGKEAQQAFKRLGLPAKQMAKMFKEDAQGALLIFLEAVKNSKDPMKELRAILGEGFADEIAGLVGGLDEYKKALGLIADKSDYAGSMQEEYNVRAKTTANSLELMRNAGKRLAIILGSTLLPAVALVADKTVQLLEPVAALATEYPQVTTAVFGVVGALAAFKVAGFAGVYAATFLSDGLIVVRGVLAALHPRLIINRVAMVAFKVEAFALAVASKVLAAGKMVLNAVLLLTRPRLLVTSAAMLVCRGASLALAAGSKVVAAGMWLINTAMSANPVGALIRLVMICGAALYALYKNCEPVRVAMDKIWDGIKTVGTVVLNMVIEKIDSLVEKFQVLAKGWARLKSFFGDDGAEFTVDTVVEQTAVAAGDRKVITGVLSLGSDGVAAPQASLHAYQTPEMPTQANFEAMSMKPVMPDELNVGSLNIADLGQMADMKSLIPDVASMGLDGLKMDSMPSLDISGIDLSALPSSTTTVEAPVTQQFNFTMHGMPDKEFADRVVDAIKSRSGSLEQIIGKIVNNIIANQKRLAYDK